MLFQSNSYPPGSYPSRNENLFRRIFIGKLANTKNMEPLQGTIKHRILLAMMVMSGLVRLQAQDLQTTERWFEFKPGEDFSESVIDVSSWLDAPAGKHGFLQMEGDAFVFEDGTPVKFWGVNICSQRPYSEKEVVDQWVQQLAKYGINGVRFHKFTSHAYSGHSSTIPDEELYRKFDYFNAELQKRGIYYGWSHIYGHRVKPGDKDRLLNYEEIAHLEYPWSWLNGTTSPARSTFSSLVLSKTSFTLASVPGVAWISVPSFSIQSNRSLDMPSGRTAMGCIPRSAESNAPPLQ